MRRQLKREIARQYFFETAAGLRIMLPESQSVVTPDLPGYSTLKQAIGRVKLPTFETWLTAQFDELKQQNASDTLARQFALIVLLVLADQVTTFNDRERYIEAINHAHDVGELKQPLIQVAELVVETGHQHFSRNVLAMRQVIAERYAEPLSLTLIAGKLHLNPVYLGQQFKQEVGRSFAQFLNDYRVSVAVDLLRGSDQDIGEIADAIGYQNSSYFFKLFKQQTGMSPGEYRKAGS